MEDRLRRPAGSLLSALVWGVLSLVTTAGARAETALIAVAANFAEAMVRLEADFERQSPHALNVTVGSTGKLYAQIRSGAPFDVLLAADQERPRRLETEGLAVPGSRFTYATGRLVLWSPLADLVAADGADTLEAGAFRRLAMANPELAPYGSAARQVLETLGRYGALRERIVMGENVGQAYTLVATGNAELGFVALAQVHGSVGPHTVTPGGLWKVPQALYDPIRQDAVLLSRAEDNSAARDLLAYLRRSEVRHLIASFGFAVD